MKRIRSVCPESFPPTPPRRGAPLRRISPSPPVFSSPSLLFFPCTYLALRPITPGIYFYLGRLFRPPFFFSPIYRLPGDYGRNELIQTSRFSLEGHGEDGEGGFIYSSPSSASFDYDSLAFHDSRLSSRSRSATTDRTESNFFNRCFTLSCTVSI